jgi:hypothetical protein
MLARIISTVRSWVKGDEDRNRRRTFNRFFICRLCLVETRTVMTDAHLCPDCYQHLRRKAADEYSTETRARLAGL